MLPGSLYDALRLFPTDSFKTAGEVGADPAAAEYLYRNGFLDCRYGGIDPIIARGLIARPEPSYRLNFHGSNALKSFDDVRDKEAQDKREKAFHRQLGVLGALIPFIIFVLGLLAEHSVIIIEWIEAFFK